MIRRFTVEYDDADDDPFAQLDMGFAVHGKDWALVVWDLFTWLHREIDDDERSEAEQDAARRALMVLNSSLENYNRSINEIL